MRWLLRFSTRSQREEINRLIAKTKFYNELNYKLSLEIIKAKAELEMMEEKKKPIYSESEVNDELQTGDSRLLGGEMRLRAPYIDDNQVN